MAFKPTLGHTRHFLWELDYAPQSVLDNDYQRLVDCREQVAVLHMKFTVVGSTGLLHCVKPELSVIAEQMKTHEDTEGVELVVGYPPRDIGRVAQWMGFGMTLDVPYDWARETRLFTTETLPLLTGQPAGEFPGASLVYMPFDEFTERGRWDPQRS